MSEERKEVIFADGVSFYLPSETAPEYVRGAIVVDKRFLEWFAKNIDSEGRVRIDLKVGRSGKAYAALSTFKPEPQIQRVDREKYALQSKSDRSPDDEIPF